ncbi:MAG: hypothetical protein HQK91_11560 [Nitrospirae bacterium]|nr:hypothetical protein [Nitrospirota bacterium]
MKRFLSSMLVLILLLLAANVYAEGEGATLALKLGFFVPHVDLTGGSSLSSGMNYELGLGFRPITNLGGEFSVGTFSSSSSSSTTNSTLASISSSSRKTSTVPILATAKFILPMAYEAFEISFGGGLGYYLLNFSSTNIINTITTKNQTSDGSIGYHIMASLDLPITKSFILGSEARWSYIGGNYKVWYGMTVNGMIKLLF